MITVAQVRKSLAQGEPVSLKFIKTDGAIITADNVVCTSSYFHNDTVNLKFNDSGEFRKVKVFSIIEFNGQEVCL
jgi:hypothetical protein